MKFMMLMYPEAFAESGEMPDVKAFEEMMAFNQELSKAGVLLALDGLLPSSAGARVRFPGGNAEVSDGPFTESKEILGGYWLLEVASREEAIGWAKKVPATGTKFVEVRRVAEMSDFPDDVQDALGKGEDLVLRTQGA